MKIRELAHARTGDKGDYSLISVICNRPESFGMIREQLTPERVKEVYGEICYGQVTRYELPKIHAFIFQLEHALGGGVTRTLAIDPHGKSLCSVMLEIDINPS